jgi:SCP-2 sterol transfer family
VSAPDPRAFFTEQLPAQLNRLLGEQQARAETARRVLEGMRAVDATIRFEVRGEGGGTWFVNIAEGRSSAAAEPSRPPFLTLSIDRKDFEPLYREAGENVLGFLGGVSGLGSEIKLTRARLDLLEAVRGSLLFELTGADGFRLLVGLGTDAPEGDPGATIRIDTETYRALREGRSEPQEAFLAGKIQVEGDPQLAMNLALAVLAPD